MGNAELIGVQGMLGIEPHRTSRSTRPSHVNAVNAAASRWNDDPPMNQVAAMPGAIVAVPLHIFSGAVSPEHPCS